MFEIWGQKQLSLSARVNAPASFRLVLLNLKITFLVTRSEGLHVCESRPPPPHAILFGCLNYTGVGKPN